MCFRSLKKSLLADVFLLSFFVFGFSSCHKKITVSHSAVQSFAVEFSMVPDNSESKPLPYARSSSPVRVKIKLKAVNWSQAPAEDFNGTVFVEARPGFVSPQEIKVVKGVAEASLTLWGNYGPTRLWIEDCGVMLAPTKKDCSQEQINNKQPECMGRYQMGTQAAGVSAHLFFSLPRIADVQDAVLGVENGQEYIDNTRSAMNITLPDRCVSISDDRYKDVSSLPLRARLSAEFDSPTQLAPKTANLVTIKDGKLIVTAVTNEGFYVTDIDPDPKKNSSNSLYVFNYSYPRGLAVGDRLLELRGSVTEFTGSTQLQNPYWVRDPNGPYPNLIPKPVKITPDFYKTHMKTLGRNNNIALGLENLEDTFVCFDNLILPEQLTNCDLNNNGRVDNRADPSSPEKLCEDKCYQDPSCTEASAYAAYNQWSATVGTDDTGNVYKIGLNVQNALPDFKILDFVKNYHQKNPNTPLRLRASGVLSQVVAARPVWLLSVQNKNDIVVNGRCP